jgi:hypothetical protein
MWKVFPQLVSFIQKISTNCEIMFAVIFMQFLLWVFFVYDVCIFFDDCV